MMHRITAIDSHTGGEPTRLVIEGWPDLGGGPLAQRRVRLDREHARFRSAVVREPRGSDVLVGGVLVEPEHRDSAAAVIFFNNVGTIGMCGHGTIGVVSTLEHLGRIAPGQHRIETPVGTVTAILHDSGEITVENVPSRRERHAIPIDVPGRGVVRGDLAWGGNWFFLTEDHGQNLTQPDVERLTNFAWRTREAANAQGMPEVDHVELFGPPVTPGAHARSFVLCPGKAWDRSPCGTGTSAKLACLAAEGKLAEGETWVQESVIGSTFEARYRWVDRDTGFIVPAITGAAYITAETTLLLDARDPFCWGLPS
jgi:4-hydroxyproline epimerase